MPGVFAEDVGVTAYHGAAALITDPGYLTTAAGKLSPWCKPVWYCSSHASCCSCVCALLQAS